MQNMFLGEIINIIYYFINNFTVQIEMKPGLKINDNNNNDNIKIKKASNTGVEIISSQLGANGT